MKFLYGFACCMIFISILASVNDHAKKKESPQELECNSIDGQRQMIKNNILHRVAIKNNYEFCLQSVSNYPMNHDKLNSDDIQNIQKSCLVNAHKMYGGSVIDLNTSHFAGIEASLRKCGEI